MVLNWLVGGSGDEADDKSPSEGSDNAPREAAADADDEEPFSSDEMAAAPPEHVDAISPLSHASKRSYHAQSVVVSIADVKAKESMTVMDHFSLPAPSSEVRFRRSNVRVYEQPNSQFVLQEHATMKTTERQVSGVSGRSSTGGGDGVSSRLESKAKLYLTVKKVSDSTYGLTFLRASYSLVAVFMGGFLFIFGLELLLFLFIDLATNLGVTHTQDRNVAAFVAVLFSVPVFVYAIAIFMAIVTRFIVDTWSGHPFLRTFGHWSVVTTDWLAFIMYLGIPLLTFAITLFQKRDDWWAVSLITWFSTVIIFWAYFAGCVIYYELQACLYLIGEANEKVKEKNMGFFGKVRKAIVHGMKTRLSGTKKELYMVNGNVILPENGNYTDSNIEPSMVKRSLMSRMTSWKIFSCFYKPLDEPKRIWTIEEVRGNVPFITRHSWSLEKLFCKAGFSSSIPVVAGPSAVTRNQARSSFACAIIGNFLFLLLVVGLMVWMGLAGAALIIVIVLIVLCCIPSIKSTLRLRRIYEDLAPDSSVEEEDDDADEEGVSAAIYQIWEEWKITTPTEAFAWIVIAAEVILFYLWPLIHLCVLRNAPSASLFGCLGLFVAARHYLNPSILIQDIGSFGSIGLKEGEEQKHEGLFGVRSKEEWEAKSRLAQIVSIGSDKSRKFWNLIFGLLV